MGPDPQHLPTLVDHGPDVDVLLEPAHLDKLQGDVEELVYGVGQCHIKDPGALVQPLKVLFDTEEVDLPIFLIPVAANAFEDGGAVVEGVGHDSDLGLGQRHEISFEEGEGRHLELLFSGHDGPRKAIVIIITF